MHLFTILYNQSIILLHPRSGRGDRRDLSAPLPLPQAGGRRNHAAPGALLAPLYRKLRPRTDAGHRPSRHHHVEVPGKKCLFDLPLLFNTD